MSGQPDGTGAAPAATRMWSRRGAFACAAIVVLLAAACGGSSAKTTKSGTPAGTATSDSIATPTPGANIGLKTPIPVSPGSTLTAQDLAARGTGQPSRGPFEGARLIIPSIKVDAPFSVKTVPASGQMPNPNSWDDVVWYDFSNWPGLGGIPGKGGNVVVAGHVDYIRHGPAVFWDLRELKAGDKIELKMKDGSTITYEVVFNKIVPANTNNFEQIVSATAGESMTLITCTGDFNRGEYNQRQIVWARRE